MLIVWVPADSEGAVNCAWLLTSVTGVPSAEVPSRKVTVPVIAGPPGCSGFTVAVKVTDVPR